MSASNVCVCVSVCFIIFAYTWMIFSLWTTKPNKTKQKKNERSNVCARTYPWITYNNGSSCNISTALITMIEHHFQMHFINSINSNYFVSFQCNGSMRAKEKLYHTHNLTTFMLIKGNHRFNWTCAINIFVINKCLRMAISLLDCAQRQIHRTRNNTFPICFGNLNCVRLTENL